LQNIELVSNSQEALDRGNAFTAATKLSNDPSPSVSGIERIDSPLMLHELVLCVALERRIARVKISSAMHEANSGHCRGEVK
jgi:hypothetical protein